MTQSSILRLIAAAGGQPKRSVAMILFAAEEIGLVGSQDWVADNSNLHDKIVTMINRDGSPGAINGAVVPPGWFEDLERITEPLVDLNSKWPFELSVNHYPSTIPTSAGGSDHSSFAMEGIPIFRFNNETDYSYRRAWHTLYDTYSELVPYTEHQQHSALVTAVVAYGIANLDEPLTREGTYLPDGLFADITTASGARVITSLDFQNAPAEVAHFIGLVEGEGGPPQGRGRGQARPPMGTIEGVSGSRITAVLEPRASGAVPGITLRPNSAIQHDGQGVFGLAGPDRFYLTLRADRGLDRSGTALGRIVAGGHTLGDFTEGDRIRSIRILRSGEEAQAFGSGNESTRAIIRE
jgi:hypothetical protein